MIAKDHNHTRRAVLGAAVAVPVLVCASAPIRAAADDAKWRGALAGYRRAEVEFKAFERHCRALGRIDPSSEAAAAFDDRYGAHLDRLYAALRRLLRVPALHVAALAEKIVLTVDHEVFTLTGGERCLAVLKRDALRLANQL